MKKYIALSLCLFLLMLSACRSGDHLQGTNMIVPATSTAAQDSETDWSFSAIEGNVLSFFPSQLFVRFAAKTDKDTLCIVAYDPADEETAPLTNGVKTIPHTVYFYDTKRNEAVGSFTLAGTESRFYAANGRLYTIDDPRIENVALRIYDNTGVCVQSVDLSADYAGLPAFFETDVLLFFFLSSDGKTLLYNAYAAETNTMEVVALDLTTETKKRVALPGNWDVKGFDVENILIQQNSDDKTAFAVYSMDGEKRKEFSFGKAKSVTGGGQYYAVYDFGQHNGSTVTVLDIAELKGYEVTLLAAEEGRRFLLSEDGETLLSFDDGNTFRVYDVKKNRQSASFDIGNIPFTGMMFACIDADHQTVYLPLGDNGKFELAAFRY